MGIQNASAIGYDAGMRSGAHPLVWAAGALAVAACGEYTRPGGGEPVRAEARAGRESELPDDPNAAGGDGGVGRAGYGEAPPWAPVDAGSAGFQDAGVLPDTGNLNPAGGGRAAEGHEPACEPAVPDRAPEVPGCQSSRQGACRPEPNADAPPGPQCRILPPELDFALVTCGCASRAEPVTIYNNGSEPFDIVGVRVEDSAKFQITGINPAGVLPLTVRPQGSVQILVRYVPTSEVSVDRGRLVIATNPPGLAGCEAVDLAGESTLETTQTDIFYQLDEPSYDILLCIENSPGMGSVQKIFGDAAQGLSAALMSAYMDFQVGVVSSEVRDANEPGAKAGIVPGHLWGAPGFPSIITPRTRDSAAALAANIAVGECCADGMGSCLEAMRLALDEPLVGDPKVNAGFLRSGGHLGLVIVSNDDAHSPAPSVFYEDFFRWVHGPRNEHLLAAHVLAGFDPQSGEPAACSSPTVPFAVPAHRYHEFYQRIGNGYEGSICTRDWDTTLRGLWGGITKAAREDRWPLSREPVPSTLRVFINGVEVFADECDGWIYDERTIAVCFGEGATPPVGAAKEFTYKAICHPP